jgi:hypothetical protein
MKVSVDTVLLAKAMKSSNSKTEKETVEKALLLLISLAQKNLILLLLSKSFIDLHRHHQYD